MTIGADTIIHPACRSKGATTIGAGCEIHSGARIVDSQIGDRVTILNHCVITGAIASSTTRASARSRTCAPAATFATARSVGNFVELKKTVLGAGSKARHLAYLGDATIGANVNIGAGTITCNYDGAQKNQTVIEDGAFIGSDTQLIAPVTVGERRLRRQRHDGPRRRARRRAGRQRGQAAQHRGLGRQEERERQKS